MEVHVYSTIVIKTFIKNLQAGTSNQLFTLFPFLPFQDQCNTAIFNRPRLRTVPYLSGCGELNYHADRLVRHRK